MFSSPVIRVTSRLLRGNIVRGFCFEKGMLDPSKHIFMNHTPQNVYTDYWEFGQYPEMIQIHSIAPRTYEPKALSIIVQTIKQKYNVQLAEEDVAQEEIEHLLKYMVKTHDNAQTFFTHVLKALSTGIFVKESKWTWIIEQQSRFSPSFISMILKSGTIETIPEFLATYNQGIERMVLISHLGTSSKINQPPTPQERHFFSEMDDKITGIPELHEERPQNTRFLNRFMKLIHGA